ncbi:hypothetical protein NKH77_04745 [Streptomyces sp. M19]
MLLAVREGRASDVPKLVGALTEAERRRFLPLLKIWRRIARSSWDNSHLRGALRVAGAGCVTGAAAAAQWLASSELRWSRVDESLFVDVMRERGPEWLGDVAHRLAERRTVAETEYKLIAQLVLAAGCEPHDGRLRPGLGGQHPVRRLHDSGEAAGPPFLTALVPRLFEVPEAGSSFQYSWDDDPGWTGALAALAEEGGSAARCSSTGACRGCRARVGSASCGATSTC